MRRKTLLAVGLLLLTAIAAACAPNATQDTLQPAGEFARKPYDLFVVVFWVAAFIFVVVEGALIFFIVRYRHRKGREGIPPQVHGNTRLEIAWTILPAVILAGIAVPTVTTIFDLAREPEPGTMRIDVLGHQWWWEFAYPEEGIVTANELHIPTGEPIYLRLCAVGLAYEGQASPSECQPGPPDGAVPALIGDSVVHSFWVPELAGTQDVVPGQTNYLWIEADEPGTYTGQCKEFCGLSHAFMKFTVVAHTPSDFARWVEQNQAPAPIPEPGSDAAAGAEIFAAQCIACHMVDGLLDAEGEPILGSNGAPNLTHFAARECFAGCMLETTDENLRRWLADPPAVKAGSKMPDLGLSGEQIDQLIAFLNTLR
ncbi:MAG TPA: cytochrome c oxidase subunit II transmembrane domain-containing protein [Actinomycetota bacterium]